MPDVARPVRQHPPGNGPLVVLPLPDVLRHAVAQVSHAHGEIALLVPFSGHPWRDPDALYSRHHRPGCLGLRRKRLSGLRRRRRRWLQVIRVLHTAKEHLGAGGLRTEERRTAQADGHGDRGRYEPSSMFLPHAITLPARTAPVATAGQRPILAGGRNIEL